MRWVIIGMANALCLLAVVTVPRENVLLRTVMTVVPAVIGIAGYLYGKYRMRCQLSSDVITSLGVMAQFLLPSLYLVAVPLEGSFLHNLSPHLDFFPDVALVALLGQTLFFVGYEVRSRPVARRVGRATVLRVIGPLRFFLMMLPVMVAVWLSRMILLQSGSYYHLMPSTWMFESPEYSILAQLSSYGLCIVAGLWAMFWTRRAAGPSRRWLLAAGGVTLIELAWHFPSGSREPVLALGVGVLFSFICVRQTVPIKSAACGLLVGLLALSFLDFYRYGIAVHANPSSISGNAITRAVIESGQEFLVGEYRSGDWITRAVARLSDARPVAAILQEVPETAPYLKGQTYVDVFWVFVPRFLYPDKPEAILPMQRMGFFQNEGGSSPTTLIGEAYMNFGWFGVALVMPFVGWFARQYDSAFLRRIAHPAWAAVYIGMAPTVARLPVQPLAVWLGVLIKAFLLAWLLTIWDKALRQYADSQSRRYV